MTNLHKLFEYKKITFRTETNDHDLAASENNNDDIKDKNIPTPIRNQKH